MSEKAPVVIYTDGACSGNPGPGGWAAILTYRDQCKEISGGEAETTNNRMELMAAISALSALKEPVAVDLYTDSNYVREGIGGWIEGWKRNGWKTAAKKPVKNAELWQALLVPVAHLGATAVREDVKTGTDHLAFVPYGIPGFNFDQEPRGYFHTHHSQSDTYDKAVEGDLRQASAVMAVTAWELANLEELLPRGAKPGPEKIPNAPSTAVAGK